MDMRDYSNTKCTNELELPGESSMGLRLLRSQQALNIDKLLSLFHGNGENVDYFVRLWEEVKHFTDEDCKNVPCDPRDERKCNTTKDWRPKVDVCPVDSVVSDAVAAEGRLAAKQVVLEDGEKEDGQRKDRDVSETMVPGAGDKKSFHCGVHGCGKVLSSLASYEAHYRHCHNHVCATCRRVFVSDFLLDIHLQENHDSYFAILSPRVDMYRCLVESCEKKFRTPELRKEHLVSSHKFPPSFSFHQPVKDHRSKLSDNSSGNDLSLSMDTSLPSALMEDNNVAMDTNVSSVASASNKKKKKGRTKDDNSHSHHEKRVPVSICFGRGSQRAFQHRRGQGRGGKGRNWYQTNAALESDTTVDIEEVDMQDLANALT